jgi:hypothetical protein
LRQEAVKESSGEASAVLTMGPNGTYDLGEVQLHTRCGQNMATDIYWCKEGYGVWNNDGDTVFLFQGSGGQWLKG